LEAESVVVERKEVFGVAPNLDGTLCHGGNYVSLDFVDGLQLRSKSNRKIMALLLMKDRSLGKYWPFQYSLKILKCIGR